MRRREFIKGITVGSLLLNIKPGVLAQKPLPDLAIIQGESPALLAKEAVSAIGGIKRFIKKGDKVILKPNIGWDRKPEQGACTNPEIVKALVELCFDAGAKEVKVMDNPCNPARRTYARSGIAKAAKEAGAKVPFCSKHKIKKVDLQGEWLKNWEVFTDFLDTDKIINLPVAKHHSLSRVTLGMKNWLGCLGGNRNQLHQNLDAAVIDLASFFKPVLTILDAYRVLWRNGPQGGRLSDVRLHKTVVAGVNYVAVDAVGVKILDLDPKEIRYLQMARERGFGEFDLEKLNVEKRTI